MGWLFGRKKTPAAPEAPASAPKAPRAADADERVVALVTEWLASHSDAPLAPGGDATTLHLGPKPTAKAPAGAVLRIRRGKLAWVDLYDPALRPTINDLIARLDKDQLWSFNGVVATKYDEDADATS